LKLANTVQEEKIRDKQADLFSQRIARADLHNVLYRKEKLYFYPRYSANCWN